LGPFTDEIALEFGQGDKNVEYQSALRRGGVYRIVEANQSNLAIHQFIGQHHQMLEAPP
jgi:hypothetical protein